MADLTREDVLKLARLARLDITDEEADTYRTELTDILQYIEQLQQADVEGLKPTSQVTGLTNVMREDEVRDYDATADDLLHIVPHRQERHIKVKRMIG
jgi:aspartyl-tRNA(Asn)/glutamyl-tRNA(Gln) amidotransferase subunit C